MDPILVSGTWFESQFQICVHEHAILRIYISFFFYHNNPIMYETEILLTIILTFLDFFFHKKGL